MFARSGRRSTRHVTTAATSTKATIPRRTCLRRVIAIYYPTPRMLPVARRVVILFAWIACAARLALAHDAPVVQPLQQLPPQPAGIPWPDASWPAGPVPDGIGDRLDRELAVVDAPDPRLGETRAVVIIHRGRLV